MHRADTYRAVLLTCTLVFGAVAYHASMENLMVSSAKARPASANCNQVTSAQYKLDNPDYET